MSLFAADPLTVYQGARGAQLTFTFFDLLFRLSDRRRSRTMGDGVGYFGSANPNSPAIWAEIQFTGWMIDGGVIMMIVLYMGALVTATIAQWQRRHRHSVPAAGGLRRGGLSRRTSVRRS